MPIPLPYVFQNLNVSTQPNAVDSSGDVIGKQVPASYLDRNFQQLANVVNVQSTPPSSPYAGMVWLDTSQSPPVIKVYDGSVWRSAGYFAQLYYQTGPSSQFATSNNTIYNICSITVPPQPVVPSRGYWHVLAYLAEDAFGGGNPVGGSQDWSFHVVRQSDNFVFTIGYLHDYKSSAWDGRVGARGMAYIGDLNINQSETYVLQLKQLGGSYNITVYQNGVRFHIILI